MSLEKQTERNHTAEFLVSEANGYRSREEVTIKEGAAQNLVAGQVLGKVTADDKYVKHDPAAEDGSETAAAVLYDHVDATGGDKKATAIVRDAEVSKDRLTFIDGISEANRDSAVESLEGEGVIVR